MQVQHSLERWLLWVEELAENDYVIIDDFLDEELFRKIMAHCSRHLPDFTQAGIGSLGDFTIQEGIRGDRTYWLERSRDIDLRAFWDLVDEAIHIMNRYCYLSISDSEFHLAHYPKGSFYDRHLDQFAGRNNRMISMVIYLNELWQPGDGGELEIFRDDDSVIVEPLAKRCALFKSADVPHQVLMAHKNRFSLTGWLLYQPVGLGQFLG
ncbi:MAG: 2OG-Fe(II) oxygenase [Flavobacteriales bacterium]|nr:2OG-Fe(II) oxygenase [Flavobacteriales bacterium]